MERILENEAHMENKGIIVFLVSFLCCILAVVKLVVDMITDICRGKEKVGNFCKAKLPWISVLSISTTVGIILLL